MKKFFENGRDILYSKQTSILFAATIIMLAVAASRVLGLLRYRTLVQFFPPQQLDTFLAAFQLSDSIFEILVLGAMSSAFVPVFSNYLGRKKEDEAWNIAGIMLNVMLVFFLAVSVVIFIFANPIYTLIAPNRSPEQIVQIASFTRILLVSQFFFVISYHLTAILESNQRFLLSSIAPLFYNLGIIISTLVFAPTLGLLAPILGVVLGSLLHLLIQLPLALKLGFRPLWSLDLRNEGVRKVAKLALPRIIELSFLQIKRYTDLYVALLAVGGLTYFKFGDSLASVPTGLFALSIAKASLPLLSRQATDGDLRNFKATFSASVKQILFFVVPISVFLAVLRLPIVRLVFGADQFSWLDTVQTGYVVSAFTFGAFAYSLSLLISRSFYALLDTSTPVKVSIATILINSGLGVFLVVGLKFPIWGLALAYSLAGVFQVVTLFLVLHRRVGGFVGFGLGGAFAKITASSLSAGAVMFILLKVLDRSAWDKKLSFLGKIGVGLPTTFDKFILDTHYTLNVVFLTSVVAGIGALVYLTLSYLLKVEEMNVVFKTLQRLPVSRLKFPFWGKDIKESETISSTPTNGL